MRTPRTSLVPSRPTRRRSRFGYDHRWWGVPESPRPGPLSYWEQTRRPLPCLAFVAPFLLTYELGVRWLAGPSGATLRTGADAWVRQGLATLGMTDQWLPPLALAVILLAWQALDPRSWRFRPSCLLGMAVESAVLAVGLVGLSKLVDLGFARLGPPAALETGPSRSVLLGFLGAGVYEEALFRLLLIPVLLGVLRLLHTPAVLAQTLAVTGSALVFSIAHHAGAPGEAFTWFAFIFRWSAGVYFAWVFVARGFGVAVGTHAAYDILVGWIGWHL
ncbi:MAG TPA: CPBP family intramembrane glutamic endopeptidase [Isosphaeraceae bacterium]|nr:CPBP family intramembrane glutamic endopeptidase [Isosphaeraceae bacterium]